MSDKPDRFGAWASRLRKWNWLWSSQGRNWRFWLWYCPHDHLEHTWFHWTLIFILRRFLADGWQITFRAEKACFIQSFDILGLWFQYAGRRLIVCYYGYCYCTWRRCKAWYLLLLGCLCSLAVQNSLCVCIKGTFLSRLLLTYLVKQRLNLLIWTFLKRLGKWIPKKVLLSQLWLNSILFI